MLNTEQNYPGSRARPQNTEEQLAVEAMADLAGTPLMSIQ